MDTISSVDDNVDNTNEKEGADEAAMSLSLAEIYPSPSPSAKGLSRPAYSLSLMAEDLRPEEMPSLPVPSRRALAALAYEQNPLRRADSLAAAAAAPLSAIESESCDRSLPSTNNDEPSEESSEFLREDDRSVATFSSERSLLSLSDKRHDALRRSAATIQRLRQENSSLREALEHSRASDVALLRTKLRGAQADCLAYKQANAELRERVSSLEDRLFKILAAKFEEEEVSPSPLSVSEALRMKLRTKQQQRLARPSSSDSVALQAELEFLQSRCRHLESVNQSYEKRLAALQDEKDKLPRQSNGTRSVTFADSQQEESPVAPIKDSKRPRIKEDPEELDKLRRHEMTRRLVREAREADQKTIQELAKEVKRLTALLPKDTVDEKPEIKANDHNTIPPPPDETIQTILPSASASAKIRDKSEPKPPSDEEKKELIVSPALPNLRFVVFTKIFSALKILGIVVTVGFALLLILIEILPSFLMND